MLRAGIIASETFGWVAITCSVFQRRWTVPKRQFGNTKRYCQRQANSIACPMARARSSAIGNQLNWIVYREYSCLLPMQIAQRTSNETTLSFSYEVVVVRGTEMNDTTPIVWNVCLEKPPLITEFAHLTRFLSVETDFVIGVRIKTALGYYSAVRGTQLIHLRPQADCGILHGCQEHIVDGWAGDRRSRAADCIAHLE